MTVLGTSVRTGAPARMGWASTPASAQRPGQVSRLSQVDGTGGPDGQPPSLVLTWPPAAAPVPFSLPYRLGLL